MKILLATLFIIVNLSASPFALALDNDQNQPISLTADSADIDDQKGISIFMGRVTLTQGSLTLTADKLTTYYDKTRKINNIIAQTLDDNNKSETKQAFLKQLPEGQTEYIKAQADTITYRIDNNKVSLLGNAIFWQNKSIFRGEKIDYDINNSQLKATGKTENSTKQRVHVTFEPLQNKQ